MGNNESRRWGILIDVRQMWIEFGILEEGQRLNVERFSNVGSDVEMAEIGRVFHAKVRAANSQ